MPDFELVHENRKRKIGPPEQPIITDFSADPQEIKEVEIDVTCSACPTDILLNMYPTDLKTRFIKERDTFYLIGMVVVMFAFAMIVSFTSGETGWGIAMLLLDLFGITTLVKGYSNLKKPKFTVISDPDETSHYVREKKETQESQ